jgi:hypothetical protein
MYQLLGTTVNVHAVKDIVFDIVVGSSVLHTVLPPWDAEPLQAFPTFVKYYKLFVYLVGYIGINARSTLYKSISVEKVGGVNESIANTQAPNK